MDLPRAHDGATDYLRLETQATPDGWRVRVVMQGELDSQTCPLLVDAVADLLTRPLLDRIEFDLAGLTFIDAAGVRSLLRCEAAAGRAGIRVEARNATPAVVHILDIVGLARHFGFRDAAADASEHAQPEADGVDDMMMWSIRARRQAHDTCRRAQDAVRRSSQLRDA